MKAIILAETLIILVIAFLVAQFPFRFIYRKEIIEFEEKMFEAIGLSRELSLAVAFPIGLTVWYLLHKKKKELKAQKIERYQIDYRN